MTSRPLISMLARLRATTAMTGVLTLLTATPSHALPVDGQVLGGQATISRDGSTLSITQSTQRGIINWRSFDIAQGEQVSFLQPSSSSVTLNRVTGSQSPSQILGSLTANGTVMLVNSNGVFFGLNSQVNVGSLVATSSDISDTRFMAGDYGFDLPGRPNAAIVNQGSITVADAGLASFVAPNVVNDGLIQAKLGKVQLGSGDAFTLDLYGDGLVSLQAGPDITSQLVSNSGVISANGGKVTLTAAAAEGVVNSVINMDGIIQATSIGEQNGEIAIFAEGSNAVAGNTTGDKGKKSGSTTVLVSGTLDASGRNAGQKGGIIEVLGDNVGILSGLLDASGDKAGGTIRIGGDIHGQGTTPTAISTLVRTGANIDADALTSGTGGSVAVWSDNYTSFAGSISARGGISGGNGGFVETSGKADLQAFGNVDASAPNGRAGTWLLDPADVTLSTAANSNETGDPNFTPSGAASIINTTAIQSDLNAGTNVRITTGGDAFAGNGDITVADSIAKSAGSDATLTLSAYRDITVNAPITSTSGKLNLLFQADNHGNGSGYIYIAAPLSSNGGNITMGGGSGAIAAGSGYAVGTANSGWGVSVICTVNAGGGDILVNGTGYNGSGNDNDGVDVVGVSAALETTGNGTITIHGIGQGNTNSGGDRGVYAYNGGVISTVNGDLTVTGRGGGAGTSNSNDGVIIYGVGSTIETTGSGNISITGVGGTGGGGSNDGIFVNATNGIQATGTGTITLTGSGGTGGGAGSEHGILINSGSITGNGGAMSISGAGGNDSGNGNSGVYVVGAISNSGSGTLSISGVGAGNTNSSGDNGVYVYSGGVISTVNGNLTVTGSSGGAGTGNSNDGVVIYGTGSTIETTGSGNLSVRGTGGGAGGSGSSDVGIVVESANGIQTTGTGTMTLDGTGGNSSGGYNYGLYVDGAHSITGNGGTMSISGTGGNDSGNYDIGVYVVGGAISNSGNGTLTINGTGQGNTNSGNDYGVYTYNGGVFSTVNGDLTVTGGGGGAGSGGSNIGIDVGGVGSTIETTGLGNIFLTGNGGTGGIGNNVGIAVNSANGIHALGSGGITLTGTAGDGNGGGDYGLYIGSSDSITGNGGAMSLTATGGNDTGNFDYGLFVNGGTISNSGSGALTISGTGGGNTSSYDDYGVYASNGGVISTADGNLIVTGSGGNSNGGDYGFYVTGAGSTVKTTGSGDVSITASAHHGNYGIDVASAEGLETTGTGTVTAVANSSSIFIDTAGSVLSNATGTAITLAASGGDFINEAGSGALSASNGRWLIYSTAPHDDTLDGLSGSFNRYSCTYGGGCLSFPATGNGMLYSYNLTAPVISQMNVSNRLRMAATDSIADAEREPLYSILPVNETAFDTRKERASANPSAGEEPKRYSKMTITIICSTNSNDLGMPLCSGLK